jgi:predicted nucleic acid-binding protein
MRNGLVIADSGPIFTLALVNKLELLDLLFDEIRIPQAVWEEISSDESKPFHERIYNFFTHKVVQIKGF